MQAAHQHGAEDHLITPRHLAQHLGPGQVHQAGGAHPEGAHLLTQTPAQGLVQWLACLLDIPSVALHILQAEGQGRLIDVAQPFAEKRLVLAFVQTQAGLGHVVAIRHRLSQGMRRVQQQGAHLPYYHLHGGMVEGQVMELQDRHHALVQRIMGIDQLHQRCPGNVQAVVAGIEARLQLLQHVAVRRIDGHFQHRQFGAAPHHLHRTLQALPQHRRAQDIVTLDNLLQRSGTGLQALQAGEGQARLQ